MSKHEQTGKSIVPLIAAVLTVLLVMGATAVVTLDQLETSRGRKIENAPQPPLTLTLVSVVLLAVAAAWTFWLIRRYGIRHIVSMVVTGLTAMLVIITPVFAWQAFNNDRDLTVVSMTCSAEVLRNTGGAPLADCTENAVETIVLLEGVNNDDHWAPDVTSGNLTREFHDLPGGKWETMITVDGPPETVAVAAVAEKDEEQVRLGSLRPYMDAESGRLRWSGMVPVGTNVSTVRVLFYLSEAPAVESAKIRFDVHECSGQTIRTFDADQCQPMEISSPLVIEKSPENTRTWRHPHVTQDNSAMMVTNLEARTYEFEPNYTSIQMYTQSTDVLVIPSAMPQVEENTISVPGESSFEITIEENTGELVYTVYVFPAGPTYASAP